ncbi:ABC transporter, ATP-binding protein [Lachnospiraceae bacterium KM106-2]|nr:ABC transporter, ATP-binding protein [Lachnospiraceae bacterium KM106-2]
MLNFLMRDIRSFIRRRNIIIILVILTLAGGAFWHVANTRKEGAEPQNPKVMLHLGVIDEDGSKYSQMLVKYFQNTDTFTNFADITLDNRKVIEADYEKGKIDAYLVIPKGFVKSLIQIDNIPIQAVINSSDPTMTIILKNILSSYEKYISSVELNAVGLYDVMAEDRMPQELIDKTNERISLALVMTALGRNSFFQMHAIEKLPATSVVEYYFYVVLAVVMLYSSMLIGIQYQRECKNGTFSRMRLVRGYTIKYLSYLIMRNIVLIGSSVCLLLKLFFAVRQEEVNAEMYLLLFIYLFVLHGLFLLLASFFMNGRGYLITGNIVILISCIIGGCAIPFMYLPTNFQKLASMTPSYFYIKRMMKLKNAEMAFMLGEKAGMLLLGAFCLLVSYWMIEQIQKKRGAALYE